MFWLNYRGRLDDQLGTIMGPNTIGEYFVVAEQNYDLHANITRLGLKINIER